MVELVLCIISAPYTSIKVEVGLVTRLKRNNLCIMLYVDLKLAALLIALIIFGFFRWGEHSYLRRKAHRGAKPLWGLEEQGVLEVRAFLFEAHPT